MEWRRDAGSFKDPSGFVFTLEGTLYRQVNADYSEPYRLLRDSGLYSELVRDGLLVPHEEVPLRIPEAPPAFAVLRPERIPFISYPYEWCFGQLKAAALLTLELQKRALRHNLVLRDATPFNVHFVGRAPLFIDTLSFGSFDEGRPWLAYRQFCEEFLAPLALVAAGFTHLAGFSRIRLSGIPLELAATLLPLRHRLRFGLLVHIYLHGRRLAALPNQHDTFQARPHARMTKTAALGLVDSLERTVTALWWTPPPTLWSTYASHSTYTEHAEAHKRSCVAEFLGLAASRQRLRIVWDLGGNLGAYSELAARDAEYVVSLDADYASIEHQFQKSPGQVGKILPLVQDLTNPSGSVGWAHRERQSLVDRGPADVALALALIHHLVIGANVPLDRVSEFFSSLCQFLVIEFVPREDSQVQRMLRLREDVFASYTQPEFEEMFGRHFVQVRKVRVRETERTLYLLERR